MMKFENSKCMECGMSVTTNEYHPYAACLMFKASRNSKTVRTALDDVMEHGRTHAKADFPNFIYVLMEAIFYAKRDSLTRYGREHEISGTLSPSGYSMLTACPSLTRYVSPPLDSDVYRLNGCSFTVDGMQKEEFILYTHVPIQ